MHISIGEAAVIIGVSVGTLRRWDREGSFHPTTRTPGQHRRYSLVEIHGFIGHGEDGKMRSHARQSGTGE